MKADDVESLIEEIERTSDEPRHYIQVYWQDGADKDGLASLVQQNWSSPFEPCSLARAIQAVMGICEHKGDAVMLSTASRKEAEQLVLRVVNIGAVALLDE